MATVLIVDDHPMMRQGLAGLLSMEEDLTVVGQAANGETAVAQAVALRPDVVTMDLRMPGLSGVEATSQIMAQADERWHPHVLVLTTSDDDDSITAALEAGASGYLLKSASADDIIAAIRAVDNGESILASPVAAALMRQVRRSATSRTLSQREREVVVLLSQGLCNAEIAERLTVEASTVKTHVEHIYTKLGVRNRSQAVAKAHELRLIAA